MRLGAVIQRGIEAVRSVCQVRGLAVATSKFKTLRHRINKTWTSVFQAAPDPALPWASLAPSPSFPPSYFSLHYCYSFPLPLIQQHTVTVHPHTCGRGDQHARLSLRTTIGTGTTARSRLTPPPPCPVPADQLPTSSSFDVRSHCNTTATSLPPTLPLTAHKKALLTTPRRDTTLPTFWPSY
jgi:hypothetical protein